MVKLSRILFVTFILRLQDYVECFQSIVIVNNKQMTYNRNGELVELEKVVGDKKAEKKPVKIVEKSNIFKTSSFVTGSNFKGLKHNKTKNRVPPGRGSLLTKKPAHPTKTPKIHRSSTAFPTIPTTTSAPPFVTTLVFSDDFTSTENSLHNTYDDIYKNDPQKYPPPITERPRPIESTIFVYSTPSPTTIFPIILKKATKKKKKKKPTTTPIPMHEHIVQNLDYYRKILAINCTKKESEKQENGEETQQVIISITPKPIMNINVQSESVAVNEKFNSDDDEIRPIEGKKDKKKKKKKHCKKKHGHGHHSHEHHLLDHLFHKGSHSHEHGHHHHHGHKHSESYSHEHGHHGYDSYSHSYEHGHGHGHSLKKKKQVHQIHNHIHHVGLKKKKKKHHKKKHEEVVYYDIPLGHEFEKAGDLFDTFYGFFEDALTEKDVVPYAHPHHRDLSSYSESESDDSWGGGGGGGHHVFGGHHFHKRSIDEPTNKENEVETTIKRSIDSSSPRKSMKITVTSEYDDSIAGQTTPINQPSGQLLFETNTKKPKKSKNKKQKKPIIGSSEESEEDYTLYDEIMGFRDDFDDSGDIDNNMKDDDDSIEYYEDEVPTNRLPDGDIIEHTTEDYSEENITPSGSIFDNVTNMFSSLGSFFSSLTGVNDKSRKPPKRRYESYDDDYEDEARATTTEKVERQSKRPKRENVLLPWYQPNFLFSNNHDELATSTTHGNWLIMPWQRDHEIATTTEGTPETSTTESLSSYNIIEKVKQFLSPSESETRQKLPNVKPKLRRKKYVDYQLWRISPKSKDDVNYLEDFKMSNEGLKIHWLKGPSSKGASDVVVPPELVEGFKEFLDENEIHFDVKSRDIQYAIQYENPRMNKRDQIELEVVNGHPMTWYRYHSYKDMQSFFGFLKRKYPNNVELVQIGWSFEGRPLTIVKANDYIDSSNLPKEPRSDSIKPAIFIQSGAESHEWLHIACTTHILNSIVHKMNGNDSASKIIKSFDWYIFPVLNPDGYEFSQNFERLWQKTRSKHFPSSNLWSSAVNWFKSSENGTENCYGVDPNRNFEYGWTRKGTSNEECSDLYAGPYALSEPEVKLVSRFLMNSKRNIQMFISLSGYGRKISFSSSKMTQDLIDDVRDIARAGVKSSKTTKYVIDSKAKRAGSIDQFAMHQANIKFSYNLETRDDSTNGFFVPASSIEDNAKELFGIIFKMVKKLIE